MVGTPDYVYWHEFFELQFDSYAIKEIYEKRIATSEVEWR